MSATRVLEMREEMCRMSGVGLSTDRQSDNRSRPRPHEDISYRVLGAAMRVHNRLGPGLKEAFYQRALSAELADSELSFNAEQPIEIGIDGVYIGQLYMDHLVEEVVIGEEKAVSHEMTNEEIAQVITRLAATRKPVGLLINFGRKYLEYRRIFRPTNSDAWKSRIRRYVWLPPQPRSAYPFRSSVDSNAALAEVTG